MEAARHFKEENPDCQVTVLYRDMRTYGEREFLYRQARERGVLFIRYDPENKPGVAHGQDGLAIKVIDPILERPVHLSADLLVLASAIVSRRDENLAQMFKVALDQDGWFLEAHVKLRPVDFATDGVFMCGLAHYPKPHRRGRGPGPGGGQPGGDHPLPPGDVPAGHGGRRGSGQVRRLRGLLDHLPLRGRRPGRQGPGRDQPGPLQGLRQLRRLLPERRGPTCAASATRTSSPRSAPCWMPETAAGQAGYSSGPAETAGP